MNRSKFVLGFFLIACSVQAVEQAALLSNDQVSAILANRIDVQHQGVGIVVGLIDRDGRRIVAHGTFDNDARPVNGDRRRIVRPRPGVARRNGLRRAREEAHQRSAFDTGQGKVEIFPESEREFFLKVADAQLTFNVDASGRATGIVLHQAGHDMPGKRLEGEAPPPKKKIAVDPAVLDRYVGRYQLAPNFVIAITREGDHLFLQATAQPKFELFAEAPTEFFLEVVDAQVTFVATGTGRATRLILHQNGRDVPGDRIE